MPFFIYAISVAIGIIAAVYVSNLKYELAKAKRIIAGLEEQRNMKPVKRATHPCQMFEEEN